jgi:hypothetical protein
MACCRMKSRMDEWQNERTFASASNMTRLWQTSTMLSFSGSESWISGSSLRIEKKASGWSVLLANRSHERACCATRLATGSSVRMLLRVWSYI